MDGVGPAVPCRPDYLFDIQIVFPRSVPDQDGLVGEAQKVGFTVWFFIDGHCVDA